LRDKGLPESALFRPQTGYYEDLAQMAAALLESLISNRLRLLQSRQPQRPDHQIVEYHVELVNQPLSAPR
jgi:hypothetical protein